MATKRKPKKKPVRKRRTTKEPVLTKLDFWAIAANAANVSRYYSEFLAETEEVFGASSSEYREAYEAAQNNALAQIGLARDLAGNIVTALAFAAPDAERLERIV